MIRGGFRACDTAADLTNVKASFDGVSVEGDRKAASSLRTDIQNGADLEAVAVRHGAWLAGKGLDVREKISTGADIATLMSTILQIAEAFL